MKLLLDEMLSPRIAVELRERGYDVVAIKERADAIGLPDSQVLALARREGRVVVTNNVRDFRRLATEAVMPGGPGHAGLILIPSTLRRTRAAAAGLVDRLQVLIRENERAGIANREVWL